MSAITSCGVAPKGIVKPSTEIPFPIYLNVTLDSCSKVVERTMPSIWGGKEGLSLIRLRSMLG